MALYFGIVYSFSCILLEIGGVRKVTSRFLAITPLFILFVLVAYNRLSNDYFGYQQMFIMQADQMQLEFGYAYLIKFLQSLGRDHDTIIFIAGALLIFTLQKMLRGSNNVNLVILLYCCFPLVYDINQTRNLLMYLIVMLSLTFVDKKKPLKYYLSIIVAFSVHRIALVYLPFYYLCKKNRDEFIKLMWKLFVIFLIASPIVINAAKWLFPAKMGFYLSAKPDLGLLVMVIYTGLDIFTVWWVDKKVRHKLSEDEAGKLEILYRFVWFSLLALPFTAYTLELKRIQRNALLAKFIYCAIAMKYMTVKERLITLLLLLLSVAFPIYVMWYTGEIYLFDYLKENSVIYYIKHHLSIIGNHI